MLVSARVSNFGDKFESFIERKAANNFFARYIVKKWSSVTNSEILNNYFQKKLMNKIKLLLIVLVSVFLASCQKDKDPVILYDIPDEFNIEIFQELDNSNSFFLEITTLDEYPENYQIEANVTTIDDKIELNIYRILPSSAPSNREETLSKKLKLNTLSLGTHALDLIIRNTVVNEGAISINPATVELDFSTKHGISANHYEVNRIAPNGYWGVASVEIDDHAIFLDYFMQKIKAVSTVFTNPKVGNYGYFSIDAQNDVILPTLTQGVYRTFYMTSDEMDSIDKQIQDYKALGIDFQATIYTAQGQIFNHVSSEPPSPTPTMEQSFSD